MKNTFTLTSVFTTKRFLFLFAFVALLLCNSATWAAIGGTYSASGTVLTISIDVASTVTVKANGTGGVTNNYTFISSDGDWSGSAPGVSSVAKTLTVTGLATYNTINIVDGAAGVNVAFDNSTTSYTYDNNFNITLDAGAGAVTFNNTCFSSSNFLSVITDRNIVVNGGTTLTTVNGDLTLSANMQATQNVNNFNGINIGTASQVSKTYVQSTGTGNVDITGRGGASASNANYGVTVMGTASNNTTIASGGDWVIVTGTGGGTGISTNNDGVYTNYASITSGVYGNVIVSGTGGGSTTGSSGAYFGYTSVSSGGSGSVTVTGTATGGSVSGVGYGVAVVGLSHITSGGSGDVYVTGEASTACISVPNFGVYIYGQSTTDTSSISSGGGDVTVTGTGGGSGATSIFNTGVMVGQYTTTTAGVIKSGGNGSVTVTGTGGNAGGG